MNTSIYNRIDENKRQTVYIMLAFVAVISAVGYFAGQYFADGSGVSFLGFALIFSGFSGFISYYSSDKIVLAISRAKEVKETDNPYIHKLVENLCIGAGLPKPKIYIIEDTAMNAFATGRDPNHAVICFTTGIIERLNKLELEGVIAHELSHIGNYDIRLMSIVSVLVGTIVLLSDWFTRGMFYGGSRKRDRSEGSGALMIVGLVLLILSPLIASLIKLALSRQREFLADSSGALLTRYPKGLADALRKISSDKEILEVANGATAHLYITNPLKGEQANFMAKLFSTHPPVVERIKKLEEM
ncbi:zinc metalloprotease HtpX [candidate division WWE3 bacterium CG08_land_8_20_14_0_20_41_10]|uniref:Protease HtpX homolog n=1 Tax=candidate division WWE3 bacterium CG08_land_8_20_14_0_20_41_10 TaxID=1975085 RepID=A0A2H0XAR1_UNCKA|nr:MAG: zinc metalloprotease HtpX [candidate division WWE3 bacterium CG08_land_8_20_14_0_20_41_10]